MIIKIQDLKRIYSLKHGERIMKKEMLNHMFQNQVRHLVRKLLLRRISKELKKKFTKEWWGKNKMKSKIEETKNQESLIKFGMKI